MVSVHTWTKKMGSQRLLARAANAIACAMIAVASSTGEAAPFTWTSTGTSPLTDGAGSWNATGGTNWFDGATYGGWGNTTADTATFGVNNGAAGTITVGAVTANRITFNSAGSDSYTLSSGTITLAGATPTIAVNASGTTTLTSRLAGSAGFTKTGPGTLRLGTANNYTGTTTVTEGMVQVTSRDNTLGNSNGQTVLLNGGGIAMVSATAAFNPLWTITVGGSGGTIENSSGFAWTLRNNLSGSGTLRLRSVSGGFSASSQGSFSGKWVIDAAFIDNAQNSWGSGAGDDFMTLVNSPSLLIRGGTLATATQGVTISSGTAGFATTQFAAASATIPGKLSGSGGARFSPSNGATITLSHTGNSYAGNTLIAGVTTNRVFLRLGAPDVVPDGPGKGDVFIFNNGAPASLSLNGFSETVNGLSSLNPATSTHSTDSQVDNGLAASTSLLTLGGNDASATFAGVIQNTGAGATLSLMKIGSGTQTLSGANTYVGTTNINAGTLRIGAGSTTGALSTSSVISGSAGATLAFDRSNTITQGTNFASVIDGAMNVSQLGSGTLVLNGENTFSGTTRAVAGTITLNGANALQNSTLDLNSADSGSVVFSLTGTNTYNIGNLIGGRNLTTSGSVVLGVGGNGTGGVYSGVLSGGGAVAKGGAGRLVFSGNNTYSGATQVSAGILEIAPGGSIGSTSGITVDGSTAELRYNAASALTRPITLTQGVISGTGTIGTAVTFASGDILSPGNSPGIQTYTSLHAWSPGGTYQWELNSLTGSAGTNWDLVDVTSGTFDLASLGSTPGSQFVLNLVTLDALNAAGPLANPFDGGSYTFAIASYNPAAIELPTGLSNTAGTDLTGLFQVNLGSWQGPQPQAGNISVKINSTATGIELIIVPEPTAVALAAIGMAAAARTLLRRRKVGSA